MGDLDEELTEAQLAEFQRCFEEFDVDNSGSIDVDELKALMQSFGHNPTDQEVRDTIAEADDDGNEEIEFEEFCRLLLRKKHEVHQQGELREAFNALDKDQDGFLSREELALVDGLTPAEVDQVLAEADKDGDGKLSLEEWMEWQ